MNNHTKDNNNLRDMGARDEPVISLVDLIDNVFYFRWHFAVTFILISSLAIIYAVISAPVYISDVLIQVEEKKGNSLGALTQVANALGAQQSPVLGEIEILRSRSVIGRAVERLKANVEVQVDNRLPVIGGWLSRVLKRDNSGLVIPLWNNSTFAWGGEVLIIDEFTVPADLYGVPLILSMNNNDSWELFNAKDNTILVKDIKVNRLTTALNGKLRVQIASIVARTGVKFKIIVFSIPSRINQILDKFVAAETKRQSNILKLTYESPSAVQAAKVVQEIAETYLQQNISRRSEEAELSLKFLNDELPKLRSRLDSAEKALNEFRSKSKTMDISSEIKEMLVKSTALEKSQLELELKRREYIERYDTSHPLMRALMSQIAGVKAENGLLAKQISNLPGVEQDYIRLARDVQVNSQLYVTLLNNAQQLQIAKAGTTGNVAIIDEAIVPERAARPRRLFIVMIGALAGIFFGFLLTQLLSTISKIVRDPRKTEQESGLPTLAVLPLDNEQDLYSQAENGVFLLAKEVPNASSIESLRSLRTSLLFALSEKPRSKVVLITSAVPAQGKSFISANLSYLLAATEKKVLLIEADIRKASLNHYLNFDRKQIGLSSVLAGEASAASAIIRNIMPNLDLLSSGPTVKNPGDLLAGDSMHALISDLATQYDYIVIDSPPLLPVHDSRSLGKSSDVSLFVVRQDTVSLNEVQDAIDVFSKSGNYFDGLIFNGFIPSNIRYGYGYGKYRHRYYGKYRYKYASYGDGYSNEKSR